MAHGTGDLGWLAETCAKVGCATADERPRLGAFRREIARDDGRPLAAGAHDKERTLPERWRPLPQLVDRKLPRAGKWRLYVLPFKAHIEDLDVVVKDSDVILVANRQQEFERVLSSLRGEKTIVDLVDLEKPSLE